MIKHYYYYYFRIYLMLGYCLNWLYIFIQWYVNYINVCLWYIHKTNKYTNTYFHYPIARWNHMVVVLNLSSNQNFILDTIFSSPITGGSILSEGQLEIYKCSVSQVNGNYWQGRIFIGKRIQYLTWRIKNMLHLSILDSLEHFTVYLMKKLM